MLKKAQLSLKEAEQGDDFNSVSLVLAWLQQGLILEYFAYLLSGGETQIAETMDTGTMDTEILHL
ncbi:hypothetical protein M514_13669 [Trichuris suis]|uniref:Uncharacterized protein n=1 Tax=Trichuris suis TaxID=68888 RepID=A0A085NDG3_9BILA|nr:hypothetical protein M513_13669 [Trichuris suis]KFD67509.1 hypothetical protein M514_13669 [Trichuris suis]